MILSGSLPSRGDDSTHLLFASADASSEAGYGGVGWLMAPGGLDRSGPVVSVEFGRSLARELRVAAVVGWRVSAHRITATLLGGFEAGTNIRPVASADVWWDDAEWMAAGRFQATNDYTSWRLATGFRGADDLPWIGPEISSAGEEPRFGAHLTAIKLPAGMEARISTGWSRRDVFGELSLWRRF